MFYKEVYKGYSPWGGIQHSNVIAKGFKGVSTAGHGGYMVTSSFAEKYLSKACIKRGDIYYNYLCYEEDCCFALVELDLLVNYGDKFKDKLVREDISLEDAKKSLIKSISFYYPDYLIEIGIEPDKEQYQYYLDVIKKDKMRIDKHPDLIIFATLIKKNIVQVKTADGVNHLVEHESYKKIRENDILLLLSNCKMISIDDCKEIEELI